MQSATVQTHANISLIKYWGKRDEQLFLPTKNSLCIALSELTTTTTIAYAPGTEDTVSFNWQAAPEISRTNIIAFMNFFRQRYGVQRHFALQTHNNFATAAGLASSSSGFAALAMALSSLCKLDLPRNEISILARHGSGSACRSVVGGFMVWHKGEKTDGTDSYAEQIFPETHWPEFRILVVVIRNDAKNVSSRKGMTITTNTSPSYQSWLEKSEVRYRTIIGAIKNKKFDEVGTIAEADWKDMEQTMLDSSPILDYWTSASRAVMKEVQSLRLAGIPCYFTTEAGPNIKIICLDDVAEKIKTQLLTMSGVLDVITCKVAGEPVVSVGE